MEKYNYIQLKINHLKSLREVYKTVIFDNGVKLLEYHEQFKIDVSLDPLSNYLDSIQNKIIELDKSIKILEDGFNN